MARWGNCDYSQLKKLQKDLQQIQRIDLEEFSTRSVYELAARLLRKVKKRTPVKTGNLRNSWSIGKVHRYSNYYVIEVFNQVEYASYVEYGHRQQIGRYVPALGKRLKVGWVPGKFMLTISEQELKRDGERIMRQKFERFLKEALNGR